MIRVMGMFVIHRDIAPEKAKNGRRFEIRKENLAQKDIRG
jgi:hypothetical protein